MIQRLHGLWVGMRISESVCMGKQDRVIWESVSNTPAGLRRSIVLPRRHYFVQVLRGPPLAEGRIRVQQSSLRYLVLARMLFN